MRRPGVEGILELLLGVTVAGVVPHTAPVPEDREGPGETFRSVGRGIRLGPRRVNEDKGAKGIATRVHAVEDHIRALELARLHGGRKLDRWGHEPVHQGTGTSIADRA